MCSLEIFKSFLNKCLFKFLYSLNYVVCLIVDFKCILIYPRHWKLKRHMIWKYFHAIMRLSFYFLDNVFWWTIFKKFDKVKIICFLILLLVLLVPYLRNQPWLVWLTGLSDTCEPKGHWYNSQSGHMPGLWARSPVGGAQEATTH